MANFERVISLPLATAPDDVKATYTDGILEVRIPCPEKKELSQTKVEVTKG